MNNQELTDTCPMPLGKYAGVPMQEVPASYLLWYQDNAKAPNRAVIEYVKDNMEVLKKERW